MSDDDDIRPIEPVHADRIEQVEREWPVHRATPADSTVVSRARQSTQLPPSGDPSSSTGIDASTAHEQIEHPIGTPADVRRTARIHDAASHGNPIAEAIERAHVASPGDRAQQLGGAAASAASGQSARVESRPGEESAHELDDPLAPVTRVETGRGAANTHSTDDPD
jgi:hypothetical protein